MSLKPCLNFFGLLDVFNHVLLIDATKELCTILPSLDATDRGKIRSDQY